MANHKIKASTQQHLDIEDITEDLVLLKSGNVSMIMLTTAVNFDILSEAEQDATIYAYGALLNSLSFPVQILIRSKKADISAYFAHLSASLASQPNPDLRAQIQQYMEFIQATVQQRTVLDKRFYFIINFSPLELGLKGIRKPAGTKSQSRAQLIADAKIALGPKREHLVKQTARLGLSTRQMATKELIELFYDIYNPATTGIQKTVIDEGAYSVPIVEPAIEVPTPAPTQPDVSGKSDLPQSNPGMVPDTQPPLTSSTPPPLKPASTNAIPPAPLTQSNPDPVSASPVTINPTSPLSGTPPMSEIPHKDQPPIFTPTKQPSQSSVPSNVAPKSQIALADLEAAANAARQLVQSTQPTNQVGQAVSVQPTEKI